MPHVEAPRLSEIIVRELVPFLGPNTARTAVRTFAERALQLRPEQLDRESAQRLVDALRPMLRTILGEGAAAAVERDLREALR